MDKIDIRDLILRELKKEEMQVDNYNDAVFTHDYLKVANSIVKKLPIYVVMQQRELLIALLKWLGDGYNLDKNAEKIADKFLEENTYCVS